MFLDITASSDQRNTMREVVKRSHLLYAGDCRRRDPQLQPRDMLLCGADKVSINTTFILNPDLINEASNKFGNQCIVVAIDAKSRRPGTGWLVYTHGGRKPTELDAVEWAQDVVERGAGKFYSPVWIATALKTALI